MTKVNRKNFLLSLSALALSSTICMADEEDGLDDIYDDKYYDLQGGPYKDTGGVGAPGKAWRFDLLRILRNVDSHNMLDRCMDNTERSGFYFTVSLYFPHTSEERRNYGYKKIPLTKEWLVRFYEKNRNAKA